MPDAPGVTTIATHSRITHGVFARKRPFGPSAGVYSLFEDFLCEQREVDAPIAPDVATVVLVVFVSVAFLVKVVTHQRRGKMN